MISDNSSLHASSNTGYHSQSNGSWRNAPEVFFQYEKTWGDGPEVHNHPREIQTAIRILLHGE